MSILINGMEMPKNCCDCSLLYEEVCDCRITGRHLDFEEAISKERPKDCPIIEVLTPHGRLIDADAIPYIFGSTHATEYDTVTKFVINKLPTIVEAEDGT